MKAQTNTPPTDKTNRANEVVRTEFARAVTAFATKQVEKEGLAMSAPVTQAHLKASTPDAFKILAGAFTGTVTEAHYQLALRINGDDSEFAWLDAQLIADSEAKAVAEWQSFVHLQGEAIDSLLMECNQLRAEVERLTVGWDKYANVQIEMDALFARAERAEAELKKWSLLNPWGGTPEIVHAFIKGQQKRIHAAQDAEDELAAERVKVRLLRSALQRRHADQAYHCNYVDAALAVTEETK